MSQKVSKENPTEGQSLPDGQSASAESTKKCPAKTWLWALAAALVVAAVVVVMIAKHGNKAQEELSLAEAVSLVNSGTPALSATMALDSVTYDPQKKLVSFYHTVLPSAGDIQQLLTDYYAQTAEEDLKVLTIVNFDQNYLSQPILAERASFRNVYRDAEGRLLREWSLTSEELRSQPDEERIRHAALIMIQHETAVTQASCPQQIDASTFITACTFDPTACLLEFSLGLALAENEIDRVFFDNQSAEQREAIIHDLAHDPAYRCSGITLRYSYFDKNGKPVASFTVAPEDYLNHHHHHE